MARSLATVSDVTRCMAPPLHKSVSARAVQTPLGSLLVLRVDLLPAPQFLQQLGKGRGPKNRGELTPVARDEAYAVQHDVVDRPPAVMVHQPVVNRSFPEAAGGDARFHLRVGTIDRLSEKSYGRRRNATKATQVGSLEQLREESNELPLLVG